MHKIIILYDHRSNECITGGQFYEENMYNCLVEHVDLDVTRENINRGRSFITKIISPILNIKYLSMCKKYDLVIFNSVEGWYFIPLVILLRSFTKTKIAIIHHHFIHLEFTGIKRFFYKMLENSFLSLSNAIITVSPYIEILCKERFKHKNIRFWPIPFSEKIIRHSENAKNNDLIFIGTIEPRKGLIYLLRALVILKNRNLNFKLRIIGKIKNNDYYQKLLKIIKDNALNVEFLGFIDNKQKNELLCTASLFVFPSLLEGFGMVIREVMAYGLPIICFDNSAMPYLVKNNINGILVENKNFKAFAEAIESVSTNWDLHEKLSEGAYETTKDTITPEKYCHIIHSDVYSIL